MHIRTFMVHTARMSDSTRFIASIVLMLLIILFQFINAAPASAMLTAGANHDHITIDFFYHGSSVSVKGESDAGVDLVIKITSAEGHQILKQKGKMGGVLWMNVGQLKFDRTPNFYGVYSTRNLDDMLTREEQEKYVIGYPALAKHVEISPAANEEERAKWFAEFVKYKEENHVYKSSHGKITTTSTPDGKQEYFILTDWPYQAAPGDYQVAVYAVKNGKVVEQAETKVNVEQVGIVKTLATMAKNNAAVYGVLSIGIALFAGVGVGLVFRKGGGAH